MISVVKASNPYKPDCGDLVCCHYAAEYLETPPTKLPDHDNDSLFDQVLQLAAMTPNPWRALDILKIDVSSIKKTYECPYTGYDSYGLVPVALVSTDLVARYRSKEMNGMMADYWFDFQFSAHMHKGRRFDLTEVERLLLGSGYTDFTGHNDGSGSRKQSKVNLSNGDYLWVWFNEWHNK